jgi:Arc/MetJ-type ribon-helix-helix transcriptional regulator
MVVFLRQLQCREDAMQKTESVTVELPSELIERVRVSVERGDYASVNEAVTDAVLQWRDAAEGTKYLRAAWEEGIKDEGPGEPMEEAMDRLEAKYRARYGEAAKKQCA